MHLRLFNIEWDTDGTDPVKDCGLPQSVLVINAPDDWDTVPYREAVLVQAAELNGFQIVGCEIESLKFSGKRQIRLAGVFGVMEAPPGPLTADDLPKLKDAIATVNDVWARFRGKAADVIDPAAPPGFENVRKAAPRENLSEAERERIRHEAFASRMGYDPEAPDRLGDILSGDRATAKDRKFGERYGREMSKTPPDRTPILEIVVGRPFIRREPSKCNECAICAVKGFTTVNTSRRLWCPTWSDTRFGPLPLCNAHAREAKELEPNLDFSVYYWDEEAEPAFKSVQCFIPRDDARYHSARMMCENGTTCKSIADHTTYVVDGEIWLVTPDNVMHLGKWPEAKKLIPKLFN